MDPADLDASLALNLVPGLGPTLTRRCLEAFGAASAVLGASVSDLASVEGLGTVRASDIRRAMDGLADGKELAREKELMDQHAVSLLVLGQAGYPSLLRHIPDPPPMLYVRGGLLESDALALAIVGARACTAYGREQADRLAALCAQAGLTIVSGGAYGIDAAAHRAALRIGGRTIAVLGSGLARPYPADHVPLFDQIAAGRASGGASGGGAVISELPMTSPPLAENFPRRNRIISGLALGVLVVEAAVRSGALITARLAAEEHHREVMALPGRVDSRASEGCHKIVREGWATLITNAADILDALGETGSLLKAGLTQKAGGKEDTAPSLFTQNLTPSQQRIVEAAKDPMAIDQLAGATGLAVNALLADLTMLQIRGVIVKESTTYRRRR